MPHDPRDWLMHTALGFLLASRTLRRALVFVSCLRSDSQPVSQSASQPVGRSVGQSVGRSVDTFVYLYFKYSKIFAPLQKIRQ